MNSFDQGQFKPKRLSGDVILRPISDLCMEVERFHALWDYDRLEIILSEFASVYFIADDPQRKFIAKYVLANSQKLKLPLAARLLSGPILGDISRHIDGIASEYKVYFDESAMDVGSLGRRGDIAVSFGFGSVSPLLHRLDQFHSQVFSKDFSSLASSFDIEKFRRDNDPFGRLEGVNVGGLLAPSGGAHAVISRIQGDASSVSAGAAERVFAYNFILLGTAISVGLTVGAVATGPVVAGVLVSVAAFELGAALFSTVDRVDRTHDAEQKLEEVKKNSTPEVPKENSAPEATPEKKAPDPKNDGNNVGITIADEPGAPLLPDPEPTKTDAPSDPHDPIRRFNCERPDLGYYLGDYSVIVRDISSDDATDRLAFQEILVSDMRGKLLEDINSYRELLIDQVKRDPSNLTVKQVLTKDPYRR